MLSAKPWKPDAVIRFLLSVFVCFVGGSILMGAMSYAASGGTEGRGVYWLIGASLLCFGVTLAGLRKPWNLDDFLPNTPPRKLFFYAAIFICFLAGLFLGSWALHVAGLTEITLTTSQMVVNMLSFQGAALVLTWFFVREHRTRWAEAFGFSNNWSQSLLLGLMLAVAFLPLGWGLQWMSGEVLSRLPFWSPEEQSAVKILRAASSWDQRMVLGLVTILLAPAAEEVLFRGILYPWLKQLELPRLALWGTSLLFALMHFNAASFVPLLALAVALTLLYEWTDNLLAPMTAHAMFNAFNFVVLFWIDKPST